MGESHSDGLVEDYLSSDRRNISKSRPNLDILDYRLISDQQSYNEDCDNNDDEDFLNDEIDLTLTELDDPLPYFLENELFANFVNESDRPVSRRFSWPCVCYDDHEGCQNGENEEGFFDNKTNQYESNNNNKEYYNNNNIENRENIKDLNRFRSLERHKCFSNLRKNSWGSLIYKFRKFCLEHDKNNLSGKSIGSLSDLNTKFTTSNEINVNSFEKKINGFNDGVIQYAVFKPIDLTLNCDSELLKGFVRNGVDKEDVVVVVKSNNGQRITSYGLTRIIRCTTRQEYEVVDHNTGYYYLLKLTNDLNTFRTYETLFDNPHPNLVEVIQLMTNNNMNNDNNSRDNNKNNLNRENKDKDNKDLREHKERLYDKKTQIYYILLNCFNYTTLDEYHINTLPSLIDFNILKEIIKSILNGLVYLHSKSMVLSRLNMKSIILNIDITNNYEYINNEGFLAKIVDLDDVKPLINKNDIQKDLWLVGNLLFNFIEGKQIESNHVFKSNLWNLSPKMYDFCTIALGKKSSFNSSIEALIHPWFTSCK